MHVPHAEYIASLPKKHVGAGALFFNSKNELLIVKPNYRDDGWLVPGGTIDAMESPHDGCVREIKEEIGLEVPSIQFLNIQYQQNPAREGVPAYDSLQFIFLGGTLTDEEIASIKLQTDELDEYKFVSADEALQLLRPALAARVRASLEAIKNNRPNYTERK